MAELNPEDFNYFRQARRRVDQTYQLGLGQNQYQREVVGNAYGRQRADLVRRFGQMRDRIPGSFARRGMLNSGMHQKAWADFASDRARSYDDLRAQRDDQLAGLTLARNQMESTRRWAVDDLEEQETARLAAIAATLRAAQGY